MGHMIATSVIWQVCRTIWGIVLGILGLGVAAVLVVLIVMALAATVKLAVQAVKDTDLHGDSKRGQ